MSERITIVVPDGTRDKLKEKAVKDGHTPSSLGRKILVDGLKVCDHSYESNGISVQCSKCGHVIPSTKIR